MNVSINMKDIITVEVEDAFFDMFDVYGYTLFTDYHRLDRNLAVMRDKGNCLIKIDGKMNREKIASIEELKNRLEEYMPDVIEILNESMSVGLGSTFYSFDFSNLKKNLLVDQLIFDILFDKYLDESEEMSRWKYSEKMSAIWNGGDKNVESDVICKQVTSAMEEYYNMMKYSQLRDDLGKLGVAPDKYEESLNPKVKESSKKNRPKFMWDYYYYNRMPITGKQFQRKLKKDSNTSYERIIRDLDDYNKFVEKLLPDDSKPSKEYFNMSMDYYYLESYKRVDFIFKLINAIPETKIAEIDKEHFWVKRFHPAVLVPYEKDNKLCFGRKNKYYRPLLMIEDEIHQQIKSGNQYDDSFYGNLLVSA